MKRHLTLILILSAWMVVLAACSAPQTTDLPSDVTATLEESATPTPTDTATPQPGKALLLTAGNTDADLAAQAAALLGEQAGQAGLTSETRESLQPVEMPPETKLVVALAAPANLTDLLAAAPQAQFIVISKTALEPAENLTVIRLQTEQQAFVAGLATTLVSDDWRSAGLIPADAPTLQNAFANGGRYFCGLCSPGWPLGLTFPLVNGPAAPGDGAAWTATAADFYDNGKAEAFYLSAAAMLPEVSAYLAGRSQFETSVKVFGDLPPPDELRAQWGATIGFDALKTLGQALPEALAGKSAGSLTAPISLTNINPDVFSPGRQAVVQNILSELELGIITPLTVPEQN